MFQLSTFLQEDKPLLIFGKGSDVPLLNLNYEQTFSPLIIGDDLVGQCLLLFLVSKYGQCRMEISIDHSCNQAND